MISNVGSYKGCAICLDDNEEPYQRLSCQHIFHKACLDRWLDVNPTCPLCRERVTQKRLFCTSHALRVKILGLLIIFVSFATLSTLTLIKFPKYPRMCVQIGPLLRNAQIECSTAEVTIIEYKILLTFFIGMASCAAYLIHDVMKEGRND